MFVEDKNINPDVDAFAKERALRGELSGVLRDPSRWPVGFVWDYSNCHACAMGMFIRAIDKRSEVELYNVADWYTAKGELGSIARRLGLRFDTSEYVINATNTDNPQTAQDVFLFGGCFYGKRAAMKPEYIAALLEAAPYAKA